MSDMDTGQSGDEWSGRRRVLAAGQVDLGRVWLGVATEVWRRRPGRLERVAGRLLRSPGLAWELSQSMAVSDRMVLLVRALAVFALNAALGLAASAASGTAAAVTFGWLIPMTAISALALAAATLARSANVGVAAGLAGWLITVLSGQAANGQFAAAVTDSALVLPYLAFAACCGALVLYATRTPRGSS